jgi:23S rRNA pseudouridine955/2504/2580 synthase
MPRDGKEVRWIEVSEDEAGQRIDNYLLARLKGVPKTHVYRILRSGEVRVNSRRVEASQRVAAGDRIRIPPVRTAEREEDIPAPHFRLPVLFEDEALVAIDKPSGIAVHGGSGVAHGVIESLRAMRPEARFLELVHRLDRETSGVLIFAKNAFSREQLKEQFAAHTVDRLYIAIVEGRIDPPEGTFQSWLRERRDLKMVSGPEHPEAKFAVTHYRTAKTNGRYSMLEVTLETGRKNQIRAHLSEAGHPVVGDRMYGSEVNPLDRLGLHAKLLGFDHPVTRKHMVFTAPVPKSFSRLVS